MSVKFSWNFITICIIYVSLVFPVPWAVRTRKIILLRLVFDCYKNFTRGLYAGFIRFNYVFRMFYFIQKMFSVLVFITQLDKKTTLMMLGSLLGTFDHKTCVYLSLKNFGKCLNVLLLNQLISHSRFLLYATGHLTLKRSSFTLEKNCANNIIDLYLPKRFSANASLHKTRIRFE